MKLVLLETGTTVRNENTRHISIEMDANGIQITICQHVRFKVNMTVVQWVFERRGHRFVLPSCLPSLFYVLRQWWNSNWNVTSFYSAPYQFQPVERGTQCVDNIFCIHVILEVVNLVNFVVKNSWTHTTIKDAFHVSTIFNGWISGPKKIGDIFWGSSLKFSPSIGLYMVDTSNLGSQHGLLEMSRSCICWDFDSSFWYQSYLQTKELKRPLCSWTV